MVKKKYLLLAIVFILIIIINQIIIHNAITLQSSDAKTINVAGKQRMYSQQITKIALYSDKEKHSSSYDKDIETLDSIIDRFIKADTYLKKRNNLLYQNTGIDSLFKKNDSFFNTIITSSNNLIEKPNNESLFRNFIIDIKNNEGPFLKSMDNIVNEYQHISENRSAFLKKMQYVFIGLTSFAFLGMFIFMFLPVFQKNKTLILLNKKLEQFKKEVQQKEEEKKSIEEILELTNTIARIGTWQVDFLNQKVTWSKVTKEIHEVNDDFAPTIDTGLNFYYEGYSRDKITELFGNSVKNGISFDEELQIVTAKGKVIWVRTIGLPKIVDNECVGMNGTFQNINPTKTAQIKLNIANEELKAILNSGDISLIRTDIHGKITYFNKGAENLLGYKSEEVINKETPIIFHDKEELIQRSEELSAENEKKITDFDIFRKLAKDNREDLKKWTYIRKDGTSIYVQLSANSIRDNTGNIIAFILVGTDITKIKEQNIQLANFAQIASHNLRAPVSNLNSLLELYELSETPEEKNLTFDKFKLVIEHLSETLNSLIEAIKIRQKKESEITIKTLSFSKITKKNKEILSEDINKLDAVITSDFSEIDTIEYNESYLESIIINLLSNSLKYSSPKRKPKIEIRSAIKEGRTQLIVKDNGLGIDLKKHGHKLFGLNSVFHRHKDSKGVGLYIVKNQVTSLKGRISCVSEIDKGTVFTITF